jgi:hypothetical protein
MSPSLDLINNSYNSTVYEEEEEERKPLDENNRCEDCGKLFRFR